MPLNCLLEAPSKIFLYLRNNKLFNRFYEQFAIIGRGEEAAGG